MSRPSLLLAAAFLSAVPLLAEAENDWSSGVDTKSLRFERKTTQSVLKTTGEMSAYLGAGMWFEVNTALSFYNNNNDLEQFARGEKSNYGTVAVKDFFIYPEKCIVGWKWPYGAYPYTPYPVFPSGGNELKVPAGTILTVKDPPEEASWNKVLLSADALLDGKKTKSPVEIPFWCTPGDGHSGGFTAEFVQRQFGTHLTVIPARPAKGQERGAIGSREEGSPEARSDRSIKTRTEAINAQ